MIYFFIDLVKISDFANCGVYIGCFLDIVLGNYRDAFGGLTLLLKLIDEEVILVFCVGTRWWENKGLG